MRHTKGIEAVPSTCTHSRSSEIDEEALIDQWHLDDDDQTWQMKFQLKKQGNLKLKVAK